MNNKVILLYSFHTPIVFEIDDENKTVKQTNIDITMNIIDFNKEYKDYESIE